MCGIFGLISRNNNIEFKVLNHLAMHARQRGKDSCGIVSLNNNSYNIMRSDSDINLIINNYKNIKTNLIMGHSRLITNGFNDNQPICRDGIIVLHNGIIVNDNELWNELNIKRTQEVDTEIIIGLVINFLNQEKNINELSDYILSKCIGTVSCAIAIPKLGKLILLSNNGSLYAIHENNEVYFSSEKFPLTELFDKEIVNINGFGLVIDIPSHDEIIVNEKSKERKNLLPVFKNIKSEENKLLYLKHNLKRCKKCLLTETMPFIKFDSNGICNYCFNYKIRNDPKPKVDFFNLIDKYRRNTGQECIVPFSGGRDSCWGLHIIVNELKLKPITYTYDWGMVTDLGRRNISRMCSKLGVENIIIADDISIKRKNIAMNLVAWLKSPNLGMISILTAGDKHFFRHVETVKRQTGINLNLWGINPLEVTYFKSGFLGVPPDFEENNVYSFGAIKQFDYQYKRLKAMFKSPGYFNSSLFDTISGEYYRSFSKKNDYFHIFDYWKWDEKICNNTLEEYEWELASDTSTTWRIGDGTAAFYNYIYYTMVGFTEHDTFRSNQIREGVITREEGLTLIEDENRPRYQNIRWYLDAIGLDFHDTIDIINSKRLI